MDRQFARLVALLSLFPAGFARVRFSVGLPGVGLVGSTIGRMLRTRVRSETITCHRRREAWEREIAHVGSRSSMP